MLPGIGICRWLAIAGTVVVASASARAQDASRPITVIVPYPAGSIGDLLPRAMADVLGQRTGLTYIIENKPGASQSIGMRAAAQAKPDGQTILFASAAALVIAPAMKKSLPYDSITDFDPIALTFLAPMYVVARRDLPANSMPELLDLARRSPTTLTYGSGGSGSVANFAGELLKTMAGIDLVQVPYAGSGPALRDVVGGHIDLTFTGSGLAVADQVKLLATTGARRTTAMPQLPTVAETGVPGYDVSSWFGFLAPAGTPKPVLEKFAADMRDAVVSGALRERLKATGNEVEVMADTPDEFRAFILRELPTWRKIVATSHIAVE